MSAIPSKTGVPDIVNSKLTNTVDFHIASTNFNSILKSYINFLALSKYYDSLKYESDPITAEATFWEQLANANINLQTFAKNPKTTKYLTRLEIQLNDNEFLKLNESGDPLIFISAKGDLIAQTTEDRDIPLTKDDTDKVSEQVSEIKSSFDLSSEDQNGEFIAWWLDKYRKCHSKVKEVLKEKLNIEDTILQEVSESIGFVFYQYLTPQGRYMHYADEDSDPTPFPFNSIIDETNYLKLLTDSLSVIVNKNPFFISFLYDNDTIIKEEKGYFRRSDTDGIRFEIDANEKILTLAYADANDRYSWAMSQFLPLERFRK